MSSIKVTGQRGGGRKIRPFELPAVHLLVSEEAWQFLQIRSSHTLKSCYPHQGHFPSGLLCPFSPARSGSTALATPCGSDRPIQMPAPTAPIFWQEWTASKDQRGACPVASFFAIVSLHVPVVAVSFLRGHESQPSGEGTLLVLSFLAEHFSSDYSSSYLFAHVTSKPLRVLLYPF